VTGVTFKDGVSYLEMGAQQIPIGDVLSVKADAAAGQDEQEYGL